MRIAVTSDRDKIFQDFERVKALKIFDIENGALVEAHEVGADDQGAVALAQYLLNSEIDVLICGLIDREYKDEIEEAGITVYNGASGDIDLAIQAFIDGELQYGGGSL